MSAYRTHNRLMLDLLRAVRDEGEAYTTRVLMLANLTHAKLQDLVEDLARRGWLEEVQGVRKAWKLTPAGTEALVALERVDALMQDFGLGL